MKFRDVLATSFSNLGRRKVRTVLTAIGVWVGILTIVTMISLGTGLQTQNVGQADAKHARTTNAKELAAGSGSLKAPDRDWDRVFLERLLSMSLKTCDRYTDAEIDRKAGFGGHEVRVWLAAFAAIGAARRVTPQLDFYRVIPEWITGMAVAHA